MVNWSFTTSFLISVRHTHGEIVKSNESTVIFSTRGATLSRVISNVKQKSDEFHLGINPLIPNYRSCTPNILSPNCLFIRGDTLKWI